jgi:hypothetical protein
MDAVIGGSDFTFRSYLGNGDGTFIPAAVPNLGGIGEFTSIELGDWNSDGHLDAALVEAGATINDLVVLLGTGDGGFGACVSFPSS